jgi:hypothetical protein
MNHMAHIVGHTPTTTGRLKNERRQGSIAAMMAAPTSAMTTAAATFQPVVLRNLIRSRPWPALR